MQGGKMGLFDKLFKKTKDTKFRVVPGTANLDARKRDIKPDYLPGFDTYSLDNEPVEVYFYVPKETAELLVNDLLTIIDKIDALVQPKPRTDYEIGCIDIYDNSVKVRYYGITYNTEFDIEVEKHSEQWYCTTHHKYL